MPREPETYVANDLFETGIGEVIVCRFKGGGRVEAGAFLLDVYCLGVKDALFHVFPSEAQFREELLTPRLSTDPRPGSWGRKLVEDAIRYAESLGISPHPAYKKGARVFGGINAEECKETFVFGREGRPVLRQTPEDNSEKFARISATLEARLGEDGFDFIEAKSSDIDESGTIIAIDSKASDGSDPLPELKAFAEDFLARHAEIFHDITYGGAPDATIASTFLNSAREMQTLSAGEGDEPPSLDQVLNYLQTIWNLRNMSEEERAITMEGLAEDVQAAMEAEVESLPEIENAFMILELRLLHADNPEQERLLMLCDLL